MKTLNKKIPHVVICGAGIGGLTVAHELAKHGIRVTIFERNDSVGGLARSSYVKTNGYKYPVEYSWRVYGTGYKNLQRILSEIPLRRKKDAFVTDRLKKTRTYIFPRTDKSELIFSPYAQENRKASSLSMRDNLSILSKILRCATMSRARMHTLDALKWKDYCTDLSTEAQNYLVKLWGPVLGMDPSFMSFPVVAPFASLLLARYVGTADSVFLLDRPTNDGWFDEWTAHLTQTGMVDIQTDMLVSDMALENGAIKSVSVRHVKTGVVKRVEADYIVCGMGVEAIAEIIGSNRELQKARTLKNMKRLARLSRQIQLSVQLFLNDRVSYPSTEPPILYFPDSPWALIIEPQAMVWGKTYSTDPAVKSVLSVGICQTDTPGLLIKKPFTRCTEKEIEQEVIAQMQAGYTYAQIRMNSGEPFGPNHVTKFYVWDSFQFDPKTKRMDTWEPKFSNNAGAGPLMPNTVTEIPNLFFATGYTKTDRFIYSMESAAEAGTTCANEILQRAEIKQRTPVTPFRSTLFLFWPITVLDRMLLAVGLPHPGAFFGGGIVLVVLYFLLLIAALAASITLIVSLV